VTRLQALADGPRYQLAQAWGCRNR
jgi:hypothetical protein